MAESERGDKPNAVIPTPRTDKLKIPSETFLLLGQKGVPEQIVKAILTLGDHARQLERELAAGHAVNADLSEKYTKLKDDALRSAEREPVSGPMNAGAAGQSIDALEYFTRTSREAVKAHGGTTDAGAHGVPTPGSFEGLENREEIIAKPLTSSAPSSERAPERAADYTTHGILEAAHKLIEAHGEHKLASMVWNAKVVIPNTPVSPPLWFARSAIRDGINAEIAEQLACAKTILRCAARFLDTRKPEELTEDPPSTDYCIREGIAAIDRLLARAEGRGEHG
jgi:hypothetical protein